MSFEKLIKAGRRRPLFTPRDEAQAVDLGSEDIEKLVPHREPFRLIDRIDLLDLPEQTARGYRRIDPADPILAGHFPGNPIYPGVLLLEMIGQLGLCLHHLVLAGRTEVLPEDQPRAVRLLRLHHGLFQAEVHPDDEVQVLAKIVEDTGWTTVVAGQVIRGDDIAALAILEAIQPDEDEA